MQIDKEAFEYAIAKIDDGNIFEIFAKDFLSAELGHDFTPVGGSKDKGVDAFQHIFHRLGNEKIIFQISTELSHEAKIYGTISKLNENGIEYTKIIYVTNRKINNAEKLIDDVLDKTNVHLAIYDIRWFSSKCNSSDKTIKSYELFVNTYLHEYSKPGKYITIANLDEDSRLFVFLNQQFESTRADLKLDNLLADTLIIYALEGTDPDKDIFKTELEIKQNIKKYLKFDPLLIDSKITERLYALTSKPRKIKFHTKKLAYCLPYETRCEISERNLKDELLHTEFYTQTQNTIKKFFKDIEVQVRDIEKLITKVFNKIFSKQGLEFSNFVLHRDSNSTIEQSLNNVISSAVDESAVIIPNKEKVKTALHLAIRDIVYNGTIEQTKFLKSLSNTYMMMFLLQWEPKLSTYFQTLASQLKVFVDNSIIIPALSERFLHNNNRRHWNLLERANKAGISMFINETLLDELVSHFKMICNKYYNLFQQQESVYLNDDFELLFIDEILIRAYFYAKKEGQIKDFNGFIDSFIDPNLRTAKQELITYLKNTFGITFISNQMWDIRVNQEDKQKLTETLSHTKDHDIKAQNDAEMMLAIYYLRDKDGESSDTGIFGYKTWWLSKDTSTYKAIIKCFGSDKYPVSCYIRPDFIYNYIALKPTKEEVDEAYGEIFPTMLGVNLSYHMPKEVSQIVQEKVKEFHMKEPLRVKQILRNLSDRLKSDPSLQNRNSVEHYLDMELQKLQDVT
ncbi:MAG: hypothetical protein LBI15_12390 [Dysgonamonadaceae bacterium]|jgi:hypothetical protein|nr:hypothetical protein [Dysgonamonadaceae bacterium]